MRERRVDVERFLGDLARLSDARVLERAHVVQAVGELDHEHAQARAIRHQHLGGSSRPAAARARKRRAAQLGHPVHQLGDFLAELGLQLGLGGAVSSRTSCTSPAVTVVTSILKSTRRRRLRGGGRVRLAGGALLTAVRTLKNR